VLKSNDQAEKVGFWNTTEEIYNKISTGSINKVAYYIYLNAGGKLFPREAVQSYQSYLESEWGENEFCGYASNNDPYGWGETWMGEDFAQWLESERTGKSHKSNFS